MPLYVYQVIEKDGSEGEVFEVLQGMNEPPLTHHPETGRPVKRLLSVPNVGGGGAAARSKANLKPSNLEKMGFTQYRKGRKGKYEKTAGSGPDMISRGE